MILGDRVASRSGLGAGPVALLPAGIRGIGEAEGLDPRVDNLLRRGGLGRPFGDIPKMGV